MAYVNNASVKDIACHVAEVFSATTTHSVHRKNTMIPMYNNDGYKYCWDTSTKMFYILGPDNNTLFMSKNPVKTHSRYEMYISLAFRRRIRTRGYTSTGDKIESI